MVMRTSVLLLAVSMSTSIFAAVQQRRPADAPPPKIVVTIDLQVGGTAFNPKEVSVDRACVFAKAASLYDVPGTYRAVNWHDDRDASLNFTVWQLGKAGDGVNFELGAGGKRHRVNTVPAGPAANRTGSGKVTFVPRGAGGEFTVDLTADTGARITGRVTCSAFVPADDNGLS